MSQNSKNSKSRWKNGVIFPVFFINTWVMVLKLSKIVQFLKICADLLRKSKSIKALCSDPSERPYYVLS